MKKHFLPITITIILFFVPFFWLAPGFVDLGGDGGRLYFIDPLEVLKNTWNLAGSYVYAFADIGYLLALTGLKHIVNSPTLLISVEHGLQLSLSFIGMYLIVKTLLLNEKKNVDSLRASLVGLVTGVVYVGLITKVGWPVALVTLNQVFLNVIMFYFLLSYCLTRKFVYILAGLFLSIIFSANFGFGSMPQLLSFYPAALLFLYIYLRFVSQKEIPWKGLVCGAGLFLGLHAFHLLPVIASLLNNSSTISSQVFSKETIQNSGIAYFVANHVQSGKISRVLFQSWLGQNAFSLLIPVVVLLGFITRKSKLLWVTGIFFAVTLFLVTANITQTGIALYTKLFYIPGFVMFRSFNEKWFFVYAFFFALMFAVSLYYLLEKKKLKIALILCVAIFAISVYRMMPFLSGKAIQTTLYQSNNVSTNFSLDPDLLDALSFVRNLPVDGKVLTVPLTFSYYQIAYGKEGGAYVGISMVPSLAGRPDFSGFWRFGQHGYEQHAIDAIRNNDSDRFIQILSYLNIRYIFRNSDTRIMDDFPGYPYVYPGLTYSSKDQLPSIKDQVAYDSFLASLPIEKIYQKRFYEIYEIRDSYIRPLIFAPDTVSTDINDALAVFYRSAYVEAKYCEKIFCGQPPNATAPSATYVKRSSVLFDVVVDLGERKTPFLVILSHPYYSPWDLSFDEVSASVVSDHITVNGYANGWIIDPTKVEGKTVLHGRIYLTSQNYFYTGVIISVITFVVIITLMVRELTKGRHEKKK